MRVRPERIRVSSRLVALEEHPAGVVAQLENGEEVLGDVMVGADGLRSAVRAILFGEQPARFTGFAAWRGTIPAADMPPGFASHSFVAWLGPHRHAMTFPIRRDLQTFNGFVPTAEILREEWGPSGDLEDLRRSFAGATASVLELIDRDFVRADHTALLPRSAAGVGNRSSRPARRRGASDLAELCARAQDRRWRTRSLSPPACDVPVDRMACLRRFAEFAARRQQRTAGHADLRTRSISACSTSPIRCRCGHGTDGMRGMLRMDPVGETMFGLLHNHDAVAAAEAPLLPPAARRSSCCARSPSGRSSCGEARSRWKIARGCGSARGRAMPASCGGPARRPRR